MHILKIILTTLLLIVSYCLPIFPQTVNNNISNPSFKDYRIAFYNLENYFDTFNDSTKNDDDFTPTGIKGWSKRKFIKKRNNIYKTLLSIGNQSPVTIIGVAEIENKYCIKQLLYETPLKETQYRYIHYESPDLRGIDVAMFYLSDRFKPLYHKPISVKIPDSNSTRDLLYVKGIINEYDTLHIFICHLPSRLGGSTQSENKRIFVAEIIRHNTDSILNLNNMSNIIIMGDMNDNPDNESIANHLCSNSSHLNNLMTKTSSKYKTGTLNHDAFWNIFDQIIVSDNLLSNDFTHVLNHKAHICNNDFLLVDDKKYGGKKLFRTYYGPKYLGGYSDHLPIYIDIMSKNDSLFPK